MQPTNSIEESLSDRYPDAERIGPHLVIDKTEWVPGKNPDPYRQYESQTEYLERYIRCIQCGIEVLNEGGLPEECDA